MPDTSTAQATDILADQQDAAPSDIAPNQGESASGTSVVNNPPAKKTPEQTEKDRLGRVFDRLQAKMDGADKKGTTDSAADADAAADDDTHADTDQAKAQQAIAARRHREQVAVMLKRVDGMPDDVVSQVLDNPALAGKFDAKWLEARTKHQDAQNRVGPTLAQLQKQVKDLEAKLAAGGDARGSDSRTGQVEDDDEFEMPESGPLKDLYDYHATVLGDERAARLHVEAVRSQASGTAGNTRGKNNAADPLANLSDAERTAVILTRAKPDLDELAAGYPDQMKTEDARIAVLEEAESLIASGSITPGTPPRDVLAMAAKIAFGPPENITKADRSRFARVNRQQIDGSPLAQSGQRGRPASAATPGSKEEHHEAFDMLLAGKKPGDVQAILRRRATG